MFALVKKYHALRQTGFAILFLAGNFIYGQDIHFSQYYFSPLSLNPANTGNFLGNYRIAANYRSQWKDIQSAYRTFSVGGEASFFPKNQHVSVGLYFLNDKSGLNLDVNKIFASVAFHKRIAGFNVSLGIQPGVVLKSIDFNAHTFPDQMNWNKGQFDNSLPNYETNVIQTSNFFDLNAGVFLSKRFGKFEPGIGYSLFHLTEPKETFVSNDNHLSIRKIATIDIKYYHNEKIILNLYSMMANTTKASDWVTGFNFEYVLWKKAFFNTSIFGGVMWRDGLNRISDAMILTAGLKYKNYTGGVSYDINISKLHTATDYKGAFEIALIWTAKNTRLVKKQIPCDRY